jgi:hypothetical protein
MHDGKPDQKLLMEWRRRRRRVEWINVVFAGILIFGCTLMVLGVVLVVGWVL